MHLFDRLDQYATAEAGDAEELLRKGSESSLHYKEHGSKSGLHYRKCWSEYTLHYRKHGAKLSLHYGKHGSESADTTRNMGLSPVFSIKSSFKEKNSNIITCSPKSGYYSFHYCHS